MKKTLLTAAVAVLAMTSFAGAKSQWYRFNFTAEDLMTWVDVDGADDSVPADNDLYNGAAAHGYNSSVGRVNSYWESTNGDTFTDELNAAVNNEGVLMVDFNMWGFDNPTPNQGSNWGDDFRPLAYRGVEAPAGWDAYSIDYPWGDPPGDSASDQLFGWDTWNSETEEYNPTPGFHWFSDDLEEKVFVFDILFDTDYYLYGNDTKLGGSLEAPNTINGDTAEMTFWFGGVMLDQNGGTELDNYWQRNMVLTGKAVPEPMTLLAVGSAVAGLGGYIRRRKQA